MHFETTEEMTAFSDARHRISAVMLERNQKGIELEKNKKIDEAIRLYEQNVADCCGGNHPYDRLVMIYKKRKQHNDAIRICRSFISVAGSLIDAGSKRQDLAPKKARFEMVLAQLEATTGDQAE